jgi:FkbM family methyltransferase
MQDFNWGNFNENFIEIIKKETFVEKIYEKYFSVEEGDIVFDIGASIGVFPYSILDKKPKHIFCFEPSYSEFKTLVLNTRHAQVTCINKAIAGHIGVFDSEQVFDNDQNITYCTTIRQVVKDYNLEKIDFLKLDCEGGEYDIFNNENIDVVLNRFRRVSGEWHLSNPTLKNKFREFRDYYLKLFKNYKIYSVDGVDITHALWSEEFINYYTEVIIHIDNKKASV